MPLLPLIAVVAFLSLPGSAGAQAPRSDPTADAARLPDVIPLFPLGEVVLFPDVARPLLIFEPRYREMMADALKGDRIIGMVLLRPGYEKDYEGRPPIYGIGCAGEIEDYELLPDGRYAILLRGLMKFRVLSEDQRKPYRLARVESLPEPVRDEDLDPLGTARERLEMHLIRVLPPTVDPPGPGLTDTQLVNLTAQALDMPDSTRQDLLEQGSVLLRARALLAILEQR